MIAAEEVNYVLKINYASLRKHDFLTDFPNNAPVLVKSLDDEKRFLSMLVALFLDKHGLIKRKKTYLEGAAKIELVFGESFVLLGLNFSANFNAVLLEAFRFLKIAKDNEVSLKDLILNNNQEIN